MRVSQDRSAARPEVILIPYHSRGILAMIAFANGQFRVGVQLTRRICEQGPVNQHARSASSATAYPAFDKGSQLDLCE
jgi:hypothetical protein